MIETYSFNPNVYFNILQFGRQLDDANFLHHLLKRAVTSKWLTPRQVLFILRRVGKLKDTIPTGELQSYCETIVSSSVYAIEEYHVMDQSLPLAEDAIREYAVKALRTWPIYKNTSILKKS
jgi:hypothetical protein